MVNCFAIFVHFVHVIMLRDIMPTAIFASRYLPAAMLIVIVRV
jgi:hypothetical protein